ncbi:beta-1,4-mannooligosaccharide/beta-1,4-mannosyl-N-acetylglucosamine phosphorylase [Enterococcus sp. AZ194]|uniref:glycoside hydrolase family 130 protein n=1 Tax=Enterococcus sp. AZ194 TaxID=2774629 RepID=UPI003F1F0CAD
MKSEKIITRYEKNPILTAKQVPYASELVFNAGVIKWKNHYIMLFRNDYAYKGGTTFGGTNLGLAVSEEGLFWKVQDEPIVLLQEDQEITRAYDPRLTVIDGEIYICFAVDTHHGTRGGIAKTTDFKTFDVLSLSLPDNRNMVLFPEKINGNYVRLERPFTVYSRGKEQFDIWSSQSPDLIYWGKSELVLAVEDYPFANNKIGPAAPPIKTDKGWLTLVHTVDIDETRGKNGWEEVWKKRYCVGLALLDLENPAKVLGIYDKPLMVPETTYEVSTGFRTNVIFPTGMILEEDGEIKIYYGAADTVMALATAKLTDLLGLFDGI